MNKNELVDAVAEATGVSKSAASASVAAVLDAITGALQRGDKVSLTGFGTFEVRNRAARTGRNPQTGETIQIKASKAPAFKAGRGLKEVVSGQWPRSRCDSCGGVRRHAPGCPAARG